MQFERHEFLIRRELISKLILKISEWGTLAEILYFREKILDYPNNKLMSLKGKSLSSTSYRRAKRQFLRVYAVPQSGSRYKSF